MFLRPLISRQTWLTWAWLILGGAAVMPYMMAGAVAEITLIGGEGVSNPLLTAQLPVFVAMLPVVAATGLVLPVRSLSVFVARSLLDADIPDVVGPRGWARRWRDACWFTIHLAVGGLLSGVTLALVPFAVLLMVLPAYDDPARASGQLLPAGWQPWWGLIVGPLSLIVLTYVVRATGTVLRWAAPPLLGPTPTEQLAISQAAARTLAARNRIARELHDSVGHALSVVTVQAAAAGRVLDTDPQFARQAMTAVEDTARRALEDLDTVLGILRDDGAVADTAPSHSLTDLPELLDSCGLRLDTVVDAEISVLPAIVSREAYRIVQECLTNALRHGADGTAELRIVDTETALRIEVVNAIPPNAASPREGRGITGLGERANILGGSVTAGPVDGRWRVVAELPVGSQP